jgi:hypothetical protein
MSIRSEVVLMASRRVLAEAGRALIHDLRGDLNLATLGAALLAEPGDPDPIRVGGRGAAESVTRGLSAASTGVAGLHALLGETTAPVMRTLAEAAPWALRVIEPVARRRGIELGLSGSLDRSALVPVPDGFSVVLAWCLVEVVLAVPLRSVCQIVSFGGEAPGLAVTWVDAGDVSQTAARAIDALSSIVSGCGDVDVHVVDGRRSLRCTVQGRRPGRTRQRKVS